MSSKSNRRSKKKAQSRKCEQNSSSGAVRPATANPPPDGKRKREASDIISDSEVSTNGVPISSTTLSQRSADVPHPAKKRQMSTVPASPSLKLSRNSPHRENLKSKDICWICTGKDERRAWQNKMDGDSINWVQCAMKTCRRWHHSSCLFVLLHKEPRSMLFCPGPNCYRALLVCPRCIAQPTRGYDKAVHQALKAFIITYETEKFKGSGSKPQPGYSPHMLSMLDEPDFDLPREEKYSGFDDNLVIKLMGNLYQAILDYDVEIQSALNHSRATAKITTQAPLAAWRLIDVHSSAVSGQHWFDIEDIGGKRSQVSQRHASITTALRAILGTSSDDSLEIPLDLTRLTYSQVHTGFVSWFAFDLVSNRFDLYELPNMRTMRAMMAAVANFGEAKWPGQGRLSLQEVQLRTWYKSEFQQGLLSNATTFRQRLEAFLKPLTKDLDKMKTNLEASRRNIVEVTLRLWSYLQSLQGGVTLIQPAIGDLFHAKLHEAYDEEGVQLKLKEDSKRKILWILCRGFQYQETHMDVVRELTVKARVIVQ